MSNIIKCQDSLINLAEKQGYLTFDDILDASYTFSLSIPEVDMVSEAIQLLGIIVYETAPQLVRQDGIDEDELDYSRTDYDAIYKELLDASPQLTGLVELVKRFPTPRYGETNMLARQVADGNRFARERLITMYMRNALKFALSISKQYDYDLEEAISSGFHGLIIAVDRYNPAGFSVFHSYAFRWIQQRIHRDCNPNWMTYYYPVHAQDKIYRALQYYETLSSGAEEYGSFQYYELISKISRKLELSGEEVENYIISALIQKYGRFSIDDIEKKEEEDAIPCELIEGEDCFFERIFRNDIKGYLKDILSCLTIRERQVIVMRYGLETPSIMTLEEVGANLGVTRERIRQIESKALRKMRHHLRGKKLSDIL